MTAATHSAGLLMLAAVHGYKQCATQVVLLGFGHSAELAPQSKLPKAKICAVTVSVWPHIKAVQVCRLQGA